MSFISIDGCVKKAGCLLAFLTCLRNDRCRVFKLGLILFIILVVNTLSFAAVPGLPFTEDFSDTNLLDTIQGGGDWSTGEQALLLAFRRNQIGDTYLPGVSAGDVIGDNMPNYSFAVGDVDGDGDPDLISGSLLQPILYLNNGSNSPFKGVTGIVIGDPIFATNRQVALRDMDGDGDLDLVVGRQGITDVLYLNNGTTDPFNGVTAVDISSDSLATYAIAIGDIDGDGDLDLVEGIAGQSPRFYLNNGTADPFNGAIGSDITTDIVETGPFFGRSLALDDMDGDGHLDLIVSNITPAGGADPVMRLYLNNGTTDPFNGASVTNIGLDISGIFNSFDIGDVDGDGYLDVVATSLLPPGETTAVTVFYRNNGTTDPFNGVTDSVILTDIVSPVSINLGDLDGDGDLDIAFPMSGRPSRYYLNNGTADPFAGVTGNDIGSDILTMTVSKLIDVDGDGDLDFITGTTLSQSIRLYKNNGTRAPFSAFTGEDLTPGSDVTTSIALGDLNGDGDLDGVFGNLVTPNQFIISQPDPFDDIIGDIGGNLPFTHAVALGDVDGDGNLDLVTGNLGKTNKLYLNNGTNYPFNAVIGSDISTDTQDTYAIALEDMDGDGDLDVVAGNAGQPNRIYLNNGTSDPFNGVTGSDIASDTDNTQSIAIGDLDGDGDPDVITGNLDQPNRLYLNNGTSDPFNGITGSDISPDVQASMAISLGDMDGDGTLDVVVGNDNQPNRLYLNNGTSDPFNGVAGSDISSNSYHTNAITLGDTDGDGDLDLVTGNAGEPNLVYHNNGTSDPFKGVTGIYISADINETTSVALGEGGDGDLVLGVGNAGQPNRGYNNRKNEGSVPDTVTGVIQNAVLGDVDGNGTLDLITSDWLFGPTRLFLNNNTDDPFAGVDPIDIGIAKAIALGDIDGDGDLDLVVGGGTVFPGPGAATNQLYLNNGTSDPFNGVSGSDFTTDIQNTTSIALGDVNGDGDIDIVVGNTTSTTGESTLNRLYLNNGTGDPFSGVTGSDVGIDELDTFSVVLDDMDEDGDLDLVTINTGQPVRLYLNNGTADPFNGVTGSDISTDSVNTTGFGQPLAIGDVDGDGDLDVLVANAVPLGAPFALIRLYLNNGTADPFNGVSGIDINFDSQLTSTIVLNDIDGDGDLDLVVTNMDQQDQLYLNNGTSDPFNGVNPENINSKNITSLSIAIGDLDGNGEPDIFTGGWGINRIYLQRPYNALWGRVSSLAVDTESDIVRAILTPQQNLPPHTRVDWYLSNDGGNRYYKVKPGVAFQFPAAGNDLRWRAELYSLSPLYTPRIDSLTISANIDTDGDGITDDVDPFPLNIAPTISGTPPTTVTVNTAFSFVPSASDADNTGTLTFSVQNKPAWASFNTATGEISGTPAGNQLGNYTGIIISVSDGIETVDMDSFTLSVVDEDAPTTAASLPGGYYNTELDLILTCDDGAGGGCAKIYYTTDGSEPTVNSSVYSTSLKISNDTTLKFFSEDISGNVSTVITEEYQIDTIPPELTITKPSGGSSLVQLIEIAGEVSDNKAGITALELEVTDGTTCLNRNEFGLLQFETCNVPAQTIPINIPSPPDKAWSLNVNSATFIGTLYTVTVRATDAAGNKTEDTTSFTFITGSQAYTTLDLNLSTSSILFNSGVDATVKLTKAGKPEADIRNNEIVILVTDPDGVTTELGPVLTNKFGQATLLNLGSVDSGIIFNKKGTWSLHAVFDGTPELAASKSKNEILLVGASAGYAVLVEGRITNQEGLASHNKTTNRIRQILLNRGFDDDNNIFYFNYDTSQDGVDGLPDKTMIRDTIIGLAGAVNGNPAPVYVILVDHGGDNKFFLDGNTVILPSELNSWLDTLQSNLSGEAAKEPVIVIDGSCYSGGFIDELSGSNRLIITSAAANEESYKGPLEPDLIRSGEYFLEELFQALEKGQNFAESFTQATAKTEVFTRRGGGSANSINQFFDEAAQHPLLDDNGDGEGSNVLITAGGDGNLAAGLVLGTGPNYKTNSADNPADVVKWTPTTFLAADETATNIYLLANDTSQVGQAFIELREPVTELHSANGTEQLEADFKRRQLNPPDPGNPENLQDYFYINYDEFTDSGKYEIFYYVEDSETGAISPSRRSVVYKNKGSNTPPSTFNLISPADEAGIKTIALFDWEDATPNTSGPDSSDPVGVTYTFRIATDPDMSDANTIYTKEELTSSQTFIDDSVGLADATIYYWQVEAIDGFGARTLSSNGPFSFRTDNQNNVPGVITGLVYSDASFSRLAGAQVQVIVNGTPSATVSTDTDGSFVLVANAGEVELSSSLTGFKDTQAKNIAVYSGETTQGVTIGMSPDQAAGQSDLSVQLTADTSLGFLGDTLIYTLTVTNNGPETANNVVIKQDLPGTALFVSASDKCGSPEINTITCEIGTLAKAASETLEITVTPQDVGTTTTSVNISANEFDPNENNNSQSVVVQMIEANADEDGDTIPNNLDNCPLDANQSQIDTDLDGLGDACDPDDDNDNLSDLEEIQLGSDPLKKDTDGDGIDDGVEVSQGRNPAVNEGVLLIIINSSGE